MRVIIRCGVSVSLSVYVCAPDEVTHDNLAVRSLTQAKKTRFTTMRLWLTRGRGGARDWIRQYEVCPEMIISYLAECPDENK
jgi:hypothetical protein